ncbi:EAL domain-containing protein [Frankia sp. Mgl5]|uniref:putative bifunctional diguanylate cyclase/phosphodiesterase n=1 Tax=Frankia sp. Mgl5 TaxID=2933793 RepID=UPI00200E583A|nr:EAL domain-containing protein [Frankia sp. Mgl5]MCK9931219.1 EAL domain-containing protein [Frankia sp. Mgl5]
MRKRYSTAGLRYPVTIETETADLVDRWFAEITAVDLLPLAAADARAWLARLAAALVRAVSAEPFRPEIGYDVGARLVHGHVTSGEALGRTVRLFGRHLAHHTGGWARPADGPETSPAGTVHPGTAHPGAATATAAMGLAGGAPAATGPAATTATAAKGLAGRVPTGTATAAMGNSGAAAPGAGPSGEGALLRRPPRADTLSGRVSAASTERVVDLLGELVRGHTETLRERTRDGQAAARRVDLGARARAERERRISQTRLHAVLSGTALGMLVADRTGRIVEASDAALEILGLSGHTAPLAWQLPEIVHPADREAVRWLWREARRGRSRGECRILRPDGTPTWVALTLSTTWPGVAGDWFGVAMLEDITERRRLQEELRFHARHDPLTGLANRAEFLDRLQAVFREAPPSARVGLCYLDLDRFKMINEGFGYEVGDQLLAEVARRLGGIAVAERTVARMGGDEFMILVPDCGGLDEMTGIARRVLDTLREPARVDGRDLPATCSIGVVEMAVADTSPSDLVAAADAALTWAKNGGKNRWTAFDPDRGTREAARGLMSRSMRPGLDRGEFSLAYQPIIDLRHGTVAGAEALLRWDHPRLGPTRPGEFIALAEDSGFIVQLGLWVLERACETARDWPAHMFISVNLSARQLREPGLVGAVEKVLDRTGLPPRRLQLELTETVLMDSGGDQVTALHALNDLGVRIVIDDFGTGWSNFAYLSTMPVRGLKLAGLFVEKLGRGTEPGRDDHLVEAIVEFARRLRLSVTAEGVEEPEQAAALRSFGADLGQGHLFGEPVPADEFAATMLSRAFAAS